MTFFSTASHRVEKWLYKRGYAHAEIRAILRDQILVAAGSLLLGLATLLFTSWLLVFGVSALLVTLNFYALAAFVQEVIGDAVGEAKQQAAAGAETSAKKGVVTGLLVQFYAKLLLTGGVLFVLIAWLKAPLTALFAGLATVLATIGVRTCLRMAGHK